MTPELLGFIISGLLAILYLMLGYLATQRGAGFGRTTKIMIFYAVVASIWEMGAAYYNYSGQDTGIALLDAWSHSIGVLVLNVLLLAATIEFLNLDQRTVTLVGLGAVWSLVIIVIVVGLLPLPVNWLPSVFWMILLGSELMLLISVWFTIRALGKAERAAVNLRIRLWLIALLILIPADVIIFLSSDWVGDILRFTSLLVGGFLIFIHSRQDLIWTIRRFFSFWFNNSVVFLALAVISVFRSPPVPWNRGWDVQNLFLDALFAYYLFPALMMINGLFNRSLFGLGSDASARVRTFASRISGSLSLPALAEVVAHEMNQIFILDYSGLFLVDQREENQDYQLIMIKPAESNKPVSDVSPGVLNFDSPLVKYFIEKKLPIEKSDIEWLKFYEAVPEEQRTWLETQPFELLVPVVLHTKLVGILAFGPKQSLERFYPANYALARELAEQMAAILDNARLLDNTLRLNTQLKIAQDEILETNKKLRELDEMKSAFIGVITHELRTPLANIQFSSQVLELYLSRVMNVEQRQQFAELNSSVKTARTLIDNLVNFAAFLNEQVALNPVEMDFALLLREVLIPLKPSIEAKNLRLQVNMIGDRFMVCADPRLIKEAVSQLVSNAVKFTQTGGMQIVCWTTAEALCFDVEDTGIGIEEARLNQVWDAFTQLQSDSVRRGLEGLGLGLSLVKYIVQAHGGHVWVESTVGAGSIFGFQIPINGPENSLPELVHRPQRLKMPQRSME